LKSTFKLNLNCAGQLLEANKQCAIMTLLMYRVLKKKSNLTYRREYEVGNKFKVIQYNYNF